MPMLWKIYYTKDEILGYFVQFFYCCVIHIKNCFKMKYSDDTKQGFSTYFSCYPNNAAQFW